MKLGSLFDGAGTACLAAEMCGIKPVWSSEIEKFPLQVTAKRFPHVQQLGDIRSINGKEIQPVDIITFGSPCQDLSIAGKRSGLDGERSGLFMEAIRVIKEMRDATNNQFPRFVVWENVPGAFSSNQGEDFRTVLESIAKVKDSDAVVPRPSTGSGTIRWSKAGCIVGDGFSIAWRTLDAQFWGVPQRRRRIYLVADFADTSAGEVLFKRKGLSRDFAESTQSWKDGEAPASPETRPCASGQVYDARGNGDGRVCPTLTGDHENRITDYTALICGVDFYNHSLTGDTESSLGVNCGMSTGRNGVLVCCALDRAAFNQGKGALFNFGIDEKTAFALTAKGPGAVCYAIGNGQADSLGMADKPGALNCMHDPQAILQAFCLQGNCIDRSETAGCNGAGVSEEVGYTLNTVDRHAVCEVRPVTMKMRSGCEGGGKGPLCQVDKSGTISCNNDQYLFTFDSEQWQKVMCVAVRRLTPTECARLHGMPDWWCKDIPHSDAAEYKMWGNGMALPNVLFVIEGIAEVLQAAKEELRHDT